LQRGPGGSVEDLAIDGKADSYVSSIFTDRDHNTPLLSNNGYMIRVCYVKLREKFHELKVGTVRD
jgi:hypothetical protein